jgi:outer membrane immunogenic protein
MLRILGAALVFIVTAGYALAADMAVPAPAPVVAPIYAPIYNWGGIYVGINGGYGFGSSTWTDSLNPVGSTGSFNVNGGLIGGTFGVQFQAESWVFGAEGDFDWQSLKGTSSSAFCTGVAATPKTPPLPTPAAGLNCETQSNWLATIRGRVGYAWNYLLVYGTAGGAWANMKTTVISGQSSNAFGWTAGVGIEYAFADRWSAKLEYLFADFASISCVGGACGFNLPSKLSANDSISFSENVIRVGVNYKFPP